MTGPVRVGIVLGSDSDLEVMLEAVKVLDALEVGSEVVVASAHRTPERTHEYATTAHARGIGVLIAGAGGAAALPGVLASFSPLPVIGVPVASTPLGGLDALLSIAQKLTWSPGKSWPPWATTAAPSNIWRSAPNRP